MTTATDDITMMIETAAIVIGVIDVISGVTGTSLVWFSISPVEAANGVELNDDDISDVIMLLAERFKRLSLSVIVVL